MTGSLWANTAELNYMGREGRDAHPSRGLVTNWLGESYGGKSFSLLDVGILSGVSYTAFRTAGLEVDYTGIDINAAAVEDCRERFGDARWEHMTVTDIRFGADSFDVVNCRHVLEHLPYYETAVRELFRVSRSKVVLTFFQPPRDPELLLRRETANGYIWLNRYSPGPLEDLLNRLAVDVQVVDIDDVTRPDRLYLCTKRA
jgi:2-polyprenyl-3-methyl-5-hydroxy-6-metoxy-1,4-benzoquinol methylase